jgi:hypothetical protein
MDAVRDAHRESRRFHITLNVTGVSALLGLYGQFGHAGLGVLGAASFGLMLMCLVWYATSAYAARSLALRGNSVLDLEDRLGLGYFRDELKVLHGSAILPRFVFDRLFAILFCLFYGGVSCGALRRDGALSRVFGMLVSMPAND